MDDVSLRIHDTHLTPTEAIVEIWPSLGSVHVPEVGEPVERTLARTEFRGKLVGPRCRYASTIEVAYAVQKHFAMTLRVVIPEPNFWDPVSPFLYHGTIEAWEQGKLMKEARFTHGLRSFRLGPQGFRLNGRPVALRGATRSLPFEDDLLQLRSVGCNTLLTPMETAGFLDSGEELGFLVIRRLTAANRSLDPGDFPLSRRTAALGILLSQDLLAEWAMILPHTRDKLRTKDTEPPFYGVELERLPDAPLPEGLSFVAGPAELLAQLEGVKLPRLVLCDQWPSAEAQAAALAAAPNIVGWVRR